MSPRTGTTPAEKVFAGRIASQSGVHMRAAANHVGYLAVALAVYVIIGVGSLTLPKAAPFVTFKYYALSVAMAAPFVVVSLAMFLLSRSQTPPRTVLNVGLGYQLLGAFMWALLDVGGAKPGIDPAEGISFVVIWVTMFPIVAAFHFGRGFVINVVASLSLFPALALLKAFGVAEIDWEQVGVMTGPLTSVAVISMAPVYFRIQLMRDLERAERLGSYELVSRLGQGGMGEVWKARHSLLAHNTAIKLIHNQVQNPSWETSRADLAVRRFEREARATVALKSSHTVDLYDFGITPSGTCYYVMELLEGLDLEALVKNYGPLPPARAVHLLRQACHSLADAHDHDLVHRDIKPANLFVSPERAGDFDFLKVLDFGMVALRPEVDPDSTRLTSEGMLTGTPAYLPPESVTSNRVDGGADIYSLGCVAFWLLTGRLVFEANTPMALVLAHSRDEPSPPSSIAELPISPELDGIVLSCLAKEPAQRPGSARELSERLLRCELAQPWTQERARQWWDAHRPAV